MLACSFGNMIITQVIVKNKLTDLEIKDREGFNCLYYATFNNHAHIVAELGKYRVAYMPSNQGTTCLHIAAQKNFIDIVKIFLNYK